MGPRASRACRAGGASGEPGACGASGVSTACGASGASRASGVVAGWDTLAPSRAEDTPAPWRARRERGEPRLSHGAGGTESIGPKAIPAPWAGPGAPRATYHARPEVVGTWERRVAVASW
ncbi:hypothetical protein CGL27_24885 [Streptomyces sp. 11-1-2]|nr:hypothetical protein CGL27_24885 [Streptomyces sp. 11-1-2]